MKTRRIVRNLLALSLAALGGAAQAQLSIPSDGSDGALIVSTNTVINLANAVSGVWSNNNTASAGQGIYDSNQWAVVFKYSYVVISNGATLSFANHRTHAPVVWLVTNNVTINGTISLDGQPLNTDPLNLPEPGPGGFRGGAEVQTGLNDGPGYGPGGGNPNAYGVYSPNYGTTNIVPLIGGSGGGGGNWNGGAGGGAILIAAAGTINMNGSCHSFGGGGSIGYARYTGGGSGGAIRLVANQILGSGQIQAYGDGAGEPGRLRLEGNVVSSTLSITPPTVGVQPDSPVKIWPAANAPTVVVTSIAGISVPPDPSAVMSSSTSADDLTIGNTGPVAIRLQTTNFPTNGTVYVYISPRNGGNETTMQAGFVSGNASQATWQATTTAPLQVGGHTIILARAVSN